jgi:cytosine/adenosine deaminase-related metal-dependent hydrolase
MLDAGVRVGLGVDGSASNERSDIFVDVKNALLVARGRGGPAALTARDALRIATRGGAEVLRRDDIGRLAPGARADAVILDAPSYTHLVYRPGVPLVARTITADRA